MLKIYEYRRFFYPIIIVIVVGAWFYCYFSKSQVTTVILVRHADRTGESLNALGLARAQELSRVLEECNISAIYASNIPRTQETAQPLADHLSLTLNIYDPANLAALAEDIKSNHRGEVVLVVGHSDTVTPTIGLLGISPQPDLIPPSEFDHLYIVTFGRCIYPRLLKMEYGANTPL